MNVVNFIMGILVAVMGLVMVVMPAKVLSIVIIILGAGAVVYGIFDIFKLRLLSQDNSYRITVLVKGLVSIVMGIIAISLPIALADAVVSILFYILGVYLILCSGASFFQALKLHEANVDTKSVWTFAFGSLVLGIIMFFLPTRAIGDIILRIVGAILIAGGVGYAFYVWKNRIDVVLPDSVQDADDAENADSTED